MNLLTSRSLAWLLVVAAALFSPGVLASGGPMDIGEVVEAATVWGFVQMALAIAGLGVLLGLLILWSYIRRGGR